MTNNTNNNYSVIWQSVSKSDSAGNLPNEDYCLHDADRGIISLSDGAGGMGVFCGEWAKYVCSNLPDVPFYTIQDLNRWLDLVWEPFCDTFQPLAEQLNMSHKFLEEGSLSTLVAVWQMEPSVFQAVVYGDSVLLVYNKRKKKFTVNSMPDIKEFDNLPRLLNWKYPASEDGFKSFHFNLQTDEIILLASDALAQYLLLANALITRHPDSTNMVDSSSKFSAIAANMVRMGFLQKSFLKDVLNPILNLLNKNKSLNILTDFLQKNGLLINDDYSIVKVNQCKNQVDHL